MQGFPERDWRILRTLHDTALDPYCVRVLDECAALVRSAAPPHDRYLRLFTLLRERDRDLALAFDDLRRSTALQRLSAMILLGVVRDDDLREFTEGTCERARGLAEMYRSRGNTSRRSRGRRSDERE